MLNNRFSRFLGVYLKIVLTILSLLAFPYMIFSQGGSCGSPGEIQSGTSTLLDRNGDGFMSNTGGAWTLTNEEVGEFEQLTYGSGGANQGWTALTGSEPTGLDDPNDVAAGGNCGNTDITTDANGGSDYAYYTIVDPDQIADNGDEYIAFAMRIADKINGAFTFSFLIDSDNNCGSDPDAICGNPCFEYEVQLNTQKNEIIIIDINGCSGTADCDTKNAAGTPNGTDAYICNPCNSSALQVCAGSSECGTSNPVFWMWTVNFSNLPGLNSSSAFSLAPATSTSPNSVIYKNTNVSDYGGIGNPSDPTGCDCATKCGGSSCSDCIQDCALSCAAENNFINPFPVELVGFSGKWDNGRIKLNWETASELNNDHFVVERTIDGQSFEALGYIPGAGNTDQITIYAFTDEQPISGINYYRIKQVDFDGRFSYSSILSIANRFSGNSFSLNSNIEYGSLEINILSSDNQSLRLELLNLNGQINSSIDFEATQGNQVQTLNTGNLSSGIYILRMSNKWGETLKYQKVLIRK